jgi:hypothetical protein
VLTQVSEHLSEPLGGVAGEQEELLFILSREGFVKSCWRWCWRCTDLDGAVVGRGAVHPSVVPGGHSPPEHVLFVLRATLFPRVLSANQKVALEGVAKTRSAECRRQSSAPPEVEPHCE